ncbi:hypothetical protein DY000_02053827 [Brassica cretica]|uniref:Uncharacterized protein n=1 Tax=Brassica cretica TaxID=69181 RepID=A0ABQ7ABG3_BRACR|nr:hypothetical protein DY000_02053827 [Brassica cretica]
MSFRIPLFSCSDPVLWPRGFFDFEASPVIYLGLVSNTLVLVKFSGCPIQRSHSCSSELGLCASQTFFPTLFFYSD